MELTVDRERNNIRFYNPYLKKFYSDFQIGTMITSFTSFDFSECTELARQTCEELKIIINDKTYLEIDEEKQIVKYNTSVLDSVIIKIRNIQELLYLAHPAFKWIHGGICDNYIISHFIQRIYDYHHSIYSTLHSDDDDVYIRKYIIKKEMLTPLAEVGIILDELLFAPIVKEFGHEPTLKDDNFECSIEIWNEMVCDKLKLIWNEYTKSGNYRFLEEEDYDTSHPIEYDTFEYKDLCFDLYDFMYTDPRYSAYIEFSYTRDFTNEQLSDYNTRINPYNCAYEKCPKYCSDSNNGAFSVLIKQQSTAWRRLWNVFDVDLSPENTLSLSQRMFLYDANQRYGDKPMQDRPLKINYKFFIDNDVSAQIEDIFKHPAWYDEDMNNVTHRETVAKINQIERERIEKSIEILRSSLPSYIEVCSADDIEDILQFELINMIEKNIAVRRCKNCGNYFVLNNLNSQYCDRADNRTGKKCSDVGYRNTFKLLMESDPALKAYNKAYKAHFARVTRGKMQQGDFLAWQEEAKTKLENVRSGILLLENFQAWLKQ